MDRTLFRHTVPVRVRNYEIDWQGIVHNAEYLHYFEVGRVAYLEELGVRVDITTIQHESRVVVARNEIDYRSPARFGETLMVHTRIAAVGETSFTFEGYIEEEGSGRAVAENISVHVWLDPEGRRPVPVPAGFRERVRAFEGRNCEFRALPASGNRLPGG